MLLIIPIGGCTDMDAVVADRKAKRRELNRKAQQRMRDRKGRNGLVQVVGFVNRLVYPEVASLLKQLEGFEEGMVVGVVVRDEKGRVRTLRP